MAASPKTTPPRHLTIGPLRALLVEWQARLGLQGYTIALKVVRASDLGAVGVWGDCDAWRMKRKAVIRILDARDYPDDDMIDDHETTLVHELLHVLMPPRLFNLPVQEDDVRYQLYEQAIDQLARTLVALKRDR